MATAKEIFDDKIPAALKEHPEAAREINAIYCVKITGEGGGEWSLDLTADPPWVKTGDTGTAQCTIEMAHEDFQAMLENPQLGMQLYFQGKLKVVGDPMLATRMSKLLALGK